jgi:tetratricopeptide (TPR) repeat protein
MKILIILAIGILAVSCTRSPESDLLTKATDAPKINMAAELAKIDTMFIADTPSIAVAHEFYLRALDMLNDDKIIFAELFYKRALANEPDSYFLLGELIKVLLRQNKTEEAFSLLKLAVQSSKATGMDFLAMARLYKEKETLDSAAFYYKKATEKMSANLGVLYEYAQLLEFSKNYPELKKIFDILLTELDYPPQLLEKQIIIYRITDAPDSAIADLLGEAFKANGIQHVEYALLQAEILASLKKYGDANEVLLTVFFMHPSKELQSSIALKIANNYELMDSITVAVVWLEQLLAREPEKHVAMNNLGYMLIDRNIDVNRGLSLVEKALTYIPDEFSYLDSKAWGLYKIGKYKESLEIFEKLEGYGINSKELWLHIAAVCEALKLDERAKDYRKKADSAEN